MARGLKPLMYLPALRSPRSTVRIRQMCSCPSGSENTLYVTAMDLPPASAEPLCSALHADAAELLAAAEVRGGELSVTLCSDNFIRQLNSDYLGNDYATDVLSFPLEHEVMLGDVVISVETAGQSAAATSDPADYSLSDELRVLLLHGFLHLRGYDHEASDSEHERMRLAEQELLGHLGWAGTGLIAKNS